jgi:hypothetical protein
MSKGGFVIADAEKDISFWKKCRQNYLTSSDVYTWITPDTPDWWSDTRSSIIAKKVSGEESVFEPDAETSVLHGQLDERHIMGKFGKAVGCVVRPTNTLWGNWKWPYIAASVDGFGCPDFMQDTMPVLFQDRVRAEDLAREIRERNSWFLLEIKKSTSTKWQKEIPEYYVAQVKTQLEITNLPYGIIVAETVKRGAKAWHRSFWDMRAYIVERDPLWGAVLAQASQEFIEALDVAKGK